MLASLNDAVPSVAVEFGPGALLDRAAGFAELEAHVKGAAKAGGKPMTAKK